MRLSFRSGLDLGCVTVVALFADAGNAQAAASPPVSQKSPSSASKAKGDHKAAATEGSSGLFTRSLSVLGFGKKSSQVRARLHSVFAVVPSGLCGLDRWAPVEHSESGFLATHKLLSLSPMLRTRSTCEAMHRPNDTTSVVPKAQSC